MDAKTEKKLFRLMDELVSVTAKIHHFQNLRGEIESQIVNIMPAPKNGATVSADVCGRKMSVTYKESLSFIGLENMNHESILAALPARVKYEVDVRKAKAILEIGEPVARGILKKHLVVKPQKPAVKIGGDSANE